MDYDDLVMGCRRPKRYGGGPCWLANPEIFEQCCALLSAGFMAEVVSLELGYNALPAFSKAFLRVSGLRPSEWQAQRGIRVRKLGPVGPRARRRKTWWACDIRKRKRRKKPGRKRKRVRKPKVDFI